MLPLHATYRGCSVLLHFLPIPETVCNLPIWHCAVRLLHSSSGHCGPFLTANGPPSVRCSGRSLFGLHVISALCDTDISYLRKCKPAFHDLEAECHHRLIHIPRDGMNCYSSPGCYCTVTPPLCATPYAAGTLTGGLEGIIASARRAACMGNTAATC